LNAAEDPAAEKTATDATITAAASDKEKETGE
jgi:hypothetical protein